MGPSILLALIPGWSGFTNKWRWHRPWPSCLATHVKPQAAIQLWQLTNQTCLYVFWNLKCIGVGRNYQFALMKWTTSKIILQGWPERRKVLRFPKLPTHNILVLSNVTRFFYGICNMAATDPKALHTNRLHNSHIYNGTTWHIICSLRTLGRATDKNLGRLS